MVRADHEDGGVLNSPDDDSVNDTSAEAAAADEGTAGERSAAPVVRRSSPMGRRKKAKSAAASTPAAPVSDDAEESSETVGAAKSVNLAKSGDVVPDEADSESAVEPDADEVASNAVYRERRRKRAVVRQSTSKRAAGDSSTLTVVAVAFTALIVVAAIILSATFGFQYYRIQQDRDLRAEYSTFAQQMVVSLTTLNPDNADQMYQNTMDKTSGRARQMFKDNMKSIAKMIREGDMVTKTSIVADAVTEATADEGSVLVVSSWSGHPKNDKKAVQSTSFRLRVDITRINGELKMTNFDWVA